MRRFATVSILVVALALAAIGCGSSSTDLPITDFAKQFSTAGCTHIFNCCNATELQDYKSNFTDQATCVTYYTNLASTYFVAYMQTSIAAGRGTYDSKKAGSCLDAFKKLGCTGSNDTNAFIATCDNFYVGKQDTGTDCSSAYDCVAGNVCVPTSGGKCTKLLELGATCQSNTAPYCNTGMYCDTSATPNKCTTLKADSVACVNGYECKNGNCTGGTCQPAVKKCTGK